MKFGIHNPSWQFDGGAAGIFPGVAAKARWAEENGFAWFSVMDHLIQIPIAGAPEEPFMEGWTVLAALAAVTSRIRLATLVTSVHYRNPALLAKIAAGVDQISQGRLTFGFGAGWFETEYRQYGYEFPKEPAMRIRQMVEALRLIKAMWTQERTTFEGKWFRVEDAILSPKPLQVPHPPIMIGGSGEQMTLRAVARHGNACNLFGDPATVRRKLEVLRRHCDEAGRDYDEIERTNTIGLLLAPTAEAAAEKRARLDAAGRFGGLCGTPAQATALVGAHAEVGIQMVISSAFANDAETLELLASEVMPQFR
ncbi:MAG: LLM class F420-dependent oxidoreductase [Alphaproteobacteria bacterium]|nr:LLM class F420-dependent oxidoreductase [Alphaproteobacteria bacterium]